MIVDPKTRPPPMCPGKKFLVWETNGLFGCQPHLILDNYGKSQKAWQRNLKHTFPWLREYCHTFWLWHVEPKRMLHMVRSQPYNCQLSQTCLRLVVANCGRDQKPAKPVTNIPWLFGPCIVPSGSSGVLRYYCRVKYSWQHAATSSSRSVGFSSSILGARMCLHLGYGPLLW